MTNDKCVRNTQILSNPTVVTVGTTECSTEGKTLSSLDYAKIKQVKSEIENDKEKMFCEQLKEQ